MLVLNKSMTITLSSDGEIGYYDGEYYQIKTGDLESVKKIFDWYQEPRRLDDYPYIEGKSAQEIKRVVQTFQKLRLLIVDTELGAERNSYYFNTYSKEVVAAIKNAKVLIIGCGTVGTSVSLCLAKLGFTHLELIDDDIVTSHSLNAQPIFAKQNVGQKKGKVIKDYIHHNISETCQVLHHDMRLSEISQLANLFINTTYDYVIDCSDEKSNQLQMDMLTLFERTKAKYIQTGYYSHFNVVARVVDYAEFRDLIAEDFYKAEFIKKYSMNKGTIIDSLTLASMMSHIVINDYVITPDKNRLVYFDTRQIKTKDIAEEMTQTKEKFYQEVYMKLEAMYPKVEISQTLKSALQDKSFSQDLLNILQYLKFLGTLDMVVQTGNEANYDVMTQLLGKKSDEGQTPLMEILQDIENRRHKRLTSNLYQDLEMINAFSLPQVQRSIQKSTENRKADLLKLLATSRHQHLDDKFYQILGLSRSLFDHLLEDLSCMSLSDYQKIIAQSELESLSFTEATDSLDYYKFRDLESQYFGSKSKAINFLHQVLSLISEELGAYFIDSYQEGNLILDVYSDRQFGKSITLTNKKKGIAYTTYDSTYRSLLLVLHEFFHMYASYQMTEAFYWNETNVLYNEVVAESILMSILTLDSRGNEQLETFQQIIKYKLYRSLVYNLEQVQFLNQVDTVIHQQGQLTVSDYDRIWYQLNQLNLNAHKFQHQEDFINNYLLNPKMYNPTEYIVKEILIAALAIQHGQDIVDSLTGGQLYHLNLSTSLNQTSLPNLITQSLKQLKGE